MSSVLVHSLVAWHQMAAWSLSTMLFACGSQLVLRIHFASRMLFNSINTCDSNSSPLSFVILTEAYSEHSSQLRKLLSMFWFLCPLPVLLGPSTEVPLSLHTCVPICWWRIENTWAVNGAVHLEILLRCQATPTWTHLWQSFFRSMSKLIAEVSYSPLLWLMTITVS